MLKFPASMGNNDDNKDSATNTDRNRQAVHNQQLGYVNSMSDPVQKQQHQKKGRRGCRRKGLYQVARKAVKSHPLMPRRYFKKRRLWFRNRAKVSLDSCTGPSEFLSSTCTCKLQKRNVCLPTSRHYFNESRSLSFAQHDNVSPYCNARWEASSDTPPCKGWKGGLVAAVYTYNMHVVFWLQDAQSSLACQKGCCYRIQPKQRSPIGHDCKTVKAPEVPVG